MKLLYGHDQAVAEFVSAVVPRCENGFGPCKAIGVVDKSGLLVGGMVYSGWDVHAKTIEMSGAAISKRWLTRETLKGLFSYPFDVIGVQMVVMRNSENQTALHRMLRAYDFKEFVIPRLFGREEAGHIWTLTQEDWQNNKFMKGRKNV